MADEELKLFGEVGLGYGHLQEDSKNIQRIFEELSNNAKKYGETVKDLSKDGNKFNLGNSGEMKKANADILELTKTTGILAGALANVDKSGKSISFGKISKEIESMGTNTQRAVDGFGKINNEAGKSGQAFSKMAIQQQGYSEALANASKNAKFYVQDTKDGIKTSYDFVNAQGETIKVLRDFKQESKGLVEVGGQIKKTFNSKGLIDTSTFEKARNEITRIQQEWAKVNADKGAKVNISENDNGFKVVQQYTNAVGELTKVQKQYQIVGEKLVETQRKVNTSINQGNKAKSNDVLNSLKKEKEAILQNERAWAKLEGGRNARFNVADTEKGVNVTRNYTNALGELVTVQKQYEMTSKGLVATQQKVNTSMDMGMKAQSTFMGQMKNRGKSMLQSGIWAVGGISMASGIKEAVSVNSQFQEQQIDIQRITKMTNNEMKEMKGTSFDIAKQTATQVQDIQKMENLWIRVGHSKMDELKELTRVTAMGMNVAKFDSAESSVTYLNSAINQLADGDWTKAQSFLDSWSKMADTTAIGSVTDLAEIVSRAGAQAKILKMDINDINSIGAIAQENMSISGDVLGTQIKSMFSRMSSEQVIKGMKELGVEITNVGQNGEETFKSFPEMMDNIVQKYNELNKAGQEVKASKMLELMGGKQQRALVTNLVKNWGDFSDYRKKSLDSVGFAEEQNEKILQSFHKQVELMKVSFQELAVGLGEAGILGVMTSFVQGTKNVVDGLNHIPESIRKLIIAGTGLLGVGTLLKNKFGGKDLNFSNLKNASKEILDVKNALGGNQGGKTYNDLGLIGKGLSNVIAQGKTFGTTFTASMKASGTATNVFSKTVSSLGAGLMSLNPYILGVAVAGGVLIATLKHIRNEKEKMAEVRDIASGKIDDQIKQETKAYEKLQKSLNGGVYTTDDGKLKYNEELKKSIESVGEAYNVESSGALKNQATLQEFIDKVTVAKIEVEALHEAEMTRGRQTAEKNKINDLEKLAQTYQRLEQVTEKINNSETGSKAQDRAIKGRAKLVSDLNEQYEQVQANAKVLGEKADFKGWKLPEGSVEALKSLGLADFSVFEKGKQSVEEFGDGAEETRQRLEDLKGTINSGDYGAIAEMMGGDAWKELANDIDMVTGRFNVLKGAMEEYANNGSLSLDTVEGLLSKYPDLAEGIEKVGDSYLLTSEALETFQDLADKRRENIDKQLDVGQGLSDFSIDDSGDIDEIIQKVNDLKFNLDDLKNIDLSGMGLEQLSNDFANLNMDLENQKITLGEYFGEFQNKINEIDWSNLNGEQVSQLSSTMFDNLTQSYSQINQMYSQGKIQASDYAREMGNIGGVIESLNAKTKGLEMDSSGVWRDMAGNVNETANSMRNAMNSMGDIGGVSSVIEQNAGVIQQALDSIGNSAEENAVMSSDSWKEFASDFASSMSEIKETSPDLFDGIVDEIAEQTGLAKEVVVENLEDSSSAMYGHAESFAGALSSVQSSLGQSLGEMANVMASNIGQIGSTIDGFNHKIQTRVIEKAGKKKEYKFELPDGNGGTKVQTMNFTLPQFDVEATGGGKSSGGGRGKKGGAKTSSSTVTKTGSDKGSSSSSSSSSDSEATTTKVDTNKLRNKDNTLSKTDIKNFLDAFNKNNNTNGKTPKKPKGSGGGGGKKGKGGGGKKSSNDMPEPLKKLIDDLQHQVNMGELTDYDMGKKIEEATKKYKGKLTEEATNKLEEKIFKLKTGGAGTKFEADVEAINQVVSVIDDEIKMLNKQSELEEAISEKGGKVVKNEFAKMELMKSKIASHETIIAKYKEMIAKVDTEINQTNKSSIGYAKTIEALSKVKTELISKMQQEKMALMDNAIAQANAMKMIQQKRKEDFDNASSELGQMQSKIVEFIHMRNDELKRQKQEQFDIMMKSLEDEDKAENDRLNRKKDRYQKETDLFRQMIQDKIEAINRQNNEENYDKNLTSEVEKLNELDRQINERKLDKSYDSKGKLIKLEKEKAEQQKKIDDMQSQHKKDNIIQGLQDQLTAHDRSHKDKMDKMNEEQQEWRNNQDRRKETLRENHEDEMKAMDERNRARHVFAEARQSLLTGYVEDVNGNMISIQEAMTQVYEESGEAFGILSEQIMEGMNDWLDRLQDMLEQLGLVKGEISEATSMLQNLLGLTGQGYSDFLGDNPLGFSSADFEKYMLNKHGYEGDTVEGKKRRNEENHQIRQKYKDQYGFNIDENGQYYSFDKLASNSQNYSHKGNPNGSLVGGMKRKDSDDWLESKRAYEVAKSTGDLAGMQSASMKGAKIRDKYGLENSYSIEDILQGKVNVASSRSYSPQVSVSMPKTYVPSSSKYSGTSNNDNRRNTSVNTNVYVSSGSNDVTETLRNAGYMGNVLTDNVAEILKRQGL